MSIKFFGYVLAILGMVAILATFAVWIVGIWTVNTDEAHSFFMTGWVVLILGGISAALGCLILAE